MLYFLENIHKVYPQPETEWKLDLILVGFSRETPIVCICVCGERERDFKLLTHKFVEVGKPESGWHGREGAGAGAGNPGKCGYCWLKSKAACWQHSVFLRGGQSFYMKTFTCLRPTSFYFDYLFKDESPNKVTFLCAGA